MAKHAKTLRRICATPAPTDVTWAEVVGLLKSLGFEEKRNDGSRRKFFNPLSKMVINMHSPHPSPVLKLYAVRQLAEQLKNYNQQ
jgi:predicted RNA binding protein YcfA (HicA-like mRNA interferase family)